MNAKSDCMSSVVYYCNQHENLLNIFKKFSKESLLYLIIMFLIYLEFEHAIR